jgi:phospholipid/cholesterol/gamma-HCH transport system substrate-binding protein
MSTRVMQQNNVAETLIGAVVIAVAVGFLAFAYLRTGSGSLSGYEINARLPKADGLSVGTDVRLAGIKIGTVTDLTLDPKTYLVTVHMSIRNDIKLPVDSSVLVTQAGFLGGQYLSITPGGDEKMMTAGSFFENAQGSIDVMGLVNRFTGGGSSTPKPTAPQAQPQPQPQATQPPAALPQGPVKAPDPGAGP